MVMIWLTMTWCLLTIVENLCEYIVENNRDNLLAHYETVLKFTTVEREISKIVNRDNTNSPLREGENQRSTLHLQMRILIGRKVKNSFFF